jgi:tRNA uridine 5-carboxymethylaminomethyl modification enzyme
VNLRADNADLRLTPKGYELGCVDSHRYKHLQWKENQLKEIEQTLQNIQLPCTEWLKLGINISQDGSKRTAADLIAKRNLSLAQLTQLFPEVASVDAQLLQQVETTLSYTHAITRAQKDIADFKRDENLKLPDSLDYNQLGFLSSEEREKLAKIRPLTVAQAARISGITRAGLLDLVKFVSKSRGRLQYNSSA